MTLSQIDFTSCLLKKNSKTLFTFSYLYFQLQVIFGTYYGEVITMRQPNEEERREFFEDLILVQAAKAPVKKKRAGKTLKNPVRWAEHK